MSSAHILALSSFVSAVALDYSKQFGGSCRHQHRRGAQKAHNRDPVPSLGKVVTWKTGNTIFYIIDTFFYISELLLVQGLGVGRQLKESIR